MKQNPKSDFQRCTTLISVDMTLYQCCFNVPLTSVKAILKLIWLVKRLDLQKDRLQKVLF